MDYRTSELLTRFGEAIDGIRTDVSDIRMELLDVKRELSDINTRLDALVSCLSTTNDTMADLKMSAEKIDAHVDFVNTMYDHVRRPLSAVLGKTLNPSATSSITHIQ